MNDFSAEDVEKVSLTEDEAGEAPKKSGLIIWLIIVLVLAAAGFAGWKLFLDKPADLVATAADSTSEQNEPPPFGSVYKIDDLIINPAGGRRVFMVSIGLECFDDGVMKELEQRESLLRDNLITMFSAQPLEVLAEVRYRQAFRSRVKKIMDYQIGKDKVSRVFFDKWVFQ